jgi:hypothetical protein
MSVYCNVKLTNGNLFEIDYACYGFLRCFSSHNGNFECWYEANNFRQQTGGRPKVIEMGVFRDQIESEGPEMIKYVEPMIGRMGGTASPEYLKEMKAFLKDLPMFKGCLEINKSKGTLRAYAGKNPADKLVLSLMASRTVQFSRANSSYMFARNAGYRPRTALLFASTFYQGIRYNPTGANGKSFNYNREGEDVIIYMPTFGEKDLKEYMNQGKNYNPWAQYAFENTDTGYTRDYDYFESEDVFNSNSVMPESDSDDPEDIDNWDDYGETEGTYFRRLNSCFSKNFGNDTHIPGIQTTNQWGEYVFKNEYHNFGEEKAIEMLDLFESYINKEK